MIDIKKLQNEQLKLGKKVLTVDSFEKLEKIGGAECFFTNNQAIAAIIVCQMGSFEIIDKAYCTSNIEFPYITEYRAYREGPSICKAYTHLNIKPDVLFFSGHGILHPRRCGLASHLGLLLDQASIGIARQNLTGEVKGDLVYVDNELRGKIVATRNHSKPIFVSPGYKISLKTSVDLLMKCIIFPHKLPEPLHLAHKYAKELKNKLTQSKINTVIGGPMV